MDRETLAAAVDALAMPYRAEAEKLWSTIKEKLQETLVEAGVDKIAKLNYNYGDSAEVEIKIPGKSYGHTMNLYFNDRWYDESSKKRVVVTLNVGTFGSFDATMEPEVNFYTVAGALAKNLSKLQEKFDAIDFGPYNVARRNYSKAQNELEKFDCIAKDEEIAKKMQEIESKLVVGAKLQIGTSWKDEPIIDEVVKVTNKLIWFKNDYGSQTKKAVAIDRILGEQWEFVS